MEPTEIPSPTRLGPWIQILKEVCYSTYCNPLLITRIVRILGTERSVLSRQPGRKRNLLCLRLSELFE